AESSLIARPHLGDEVLERRLDGAPAPLPLAGAVGALGLRQLARRALGLAKDLVDVVAGQVELELLALAVLAPFLIARQRRAAVAGQRLDAVRRAWQLGVGHRLVRTRLEVAHGQQRLALALRF